jgi:hypothetical protein
MTMAFRNVRAWLCLSLAGVAACGHRVDTRADFPAAMLDTNTSRTQAAEAGVLAFARRNLGSQVGSGECAELADRALTSIGAATWSDYTPAAADRDYVWGQRISPEEARPGDIVQLRDYDAVATTTDKLGTVRSEDYSPNHTAIVEENLGDALAILQQNAEPLGRIVHRAILPIRTGTYAGTPHGVASDPHASTTVVVEGVMSVYRPVMKRNPCL